jgi:CBS domain-containing protein/ribosome-associated translation inhibitor RaiA
LQPIDRLVSELVVLPENSSLSKIIAFLRDQNVYEIFFPEGNRCSMISVRDILKLRNVESTKPSSIMVHAPTIPKQATVGQAAKLLVDHGVSAIPVFDNGQAVGQVSRLRLLSELRGKTGAEIRVTSIASGRPTTVEGTTSVATARGLMIRKKINHLPVMEERRLSSLITSTHIISRMSPSERVGSKSMTHEIKRALDFSVRDVMETNPLTFPAETTVETALDSTLISGQKCILITQWDELQGIATQGDFTRLLIEPEPKLEVPISMIGLPEDPFEAEAAKTKFSRTVNQLHRIFPDILEAKSVIKSKFSKPGKERGRYEVTVHITTPKKTYTYSETGWELPVVYDLLTDKLKRLMSQQKHRTRREREQAEET